MPKKKTSESKRAYDIGYIMQHVTQKRISFNDNNPDDRELLDHINRQPNQTQYLKGLIREDMGRSRG